MGQQPPGRGKRPNKVIIESDRKCAQGERSEERQRVVRLAPEEQCSDQPVPKGKNARDNDDVGSKEVYGKAEFLKPSHVAGRKLHIRIASSGCACTKHVERRKVRRDAGDKESHGQST